jgi:hypothetical protein
MHRVNNDCRIANFNPETLQQIVHLQSKALQEGYSVAKQTNTSSSTTI